MSEVVRVQRRLAAILSADVAGYSRLMGDDEVATIRTLSEYRAAIAEIVAAHYGRIVDMRKCAASSNSTSRTWESTS